MSKSARVPTEHVRDDVPLSPTLTPPAFGLQEQFDEGGVERTQPGSRRGLRAGSERLQDLHEQLQILDI